VSQPPSGGEEPNPGARGNLVALIAVVVLIALGYWAFSWLDRQRKLQNCLDSGRRNCEQWLDQR
jgi:hypothetical protein